MLKLVVNTKADIPEGMESVYKEKNGVFHLQLDGDVVPKTKLDEFRNTNIGLLKDSEDLKKKLAQFDGVDLDAYKSALEKQQLIDDKQLLDSGKVEELVEKRVERMKADFDGQTTALNTRIEELNGTNNTLTSQLSNVLIDSEIQRAINEVGKPREGAVQDILNRGRSLFKLIEGKPTPVGGDGNPIFGKDGKAPMTFVEWAKGLQETAGFLFETATGGGSPGNRSGGTTPPSKTITSGDPISFGNNLEDIASGKVAVVS